MNTKKKWLKYWQKIQQPLKGLGSLLTKADIEAASFGQDLINWVFIGISYLVLSAGFGAIAYKILAVGGIEAVLAQLMASTCINNAGVPCDYTTLLAGVGLSLILITSWAAYFFRVVIAYDNMLFPVTEVKEPCRFYNEEMASVLADIQRLGGIENIKGLADWKGIPYSTMRRYIKRYEVDGYVKVKHNGKGSPVEVVIV